ncbi:unnamed protein product [Brachionus calyciflorus]|uniref:C-type lectin domain-containing protein n=1 Tax=Brachionus calyciflorus TaxID=104777 RepID=A0A813NPE0_9BILA|nr:unnamed protein product [Brachionus calyciflorus]
MLKITLLDKFFCLQICSMNSDCAYAFYEGNECVLFNIDFEYDYSLSNDKIIYQKVNFELQEQLAIDLNQNLLVFECVDSSHFWSLNTNSCEICKIGFVKYSELPFNCYHYATGSKNYAGSKSYCQSKGGVLFRPKTQNERFFFIQRFPFKTTLIDSKITNLGEKFKWPDGSDVIGFGKGEPNNLMYTWLLKEDCLELRSTGFFNDVPCNTYNDLTICQHN